MNPKDIQTGISIPKFHDISSFFKFLDISMHRFFQPFSMFSSARGNPEIYISSLNFYSYSKTSW